MQNLKRIARIVIFIGLGFLLAWGINLPSKVEKDYDSLELRVQVLERIYKEHLEECYFISKYDIDVGHDNYLRLKKPYRKREQMQKPLEYDSIRY